ncbi:unnamed protein product, partial [Cuscuta campestris]
RILISSSLDGEIHFAPGRSRKKIGRGKRKR